MIPLKLSVRNFLCYRDNVPTLDFEGIHIACLCGDNRLDHSPQNMATLRQISHNLLKRETSIGVLQNRRRGDVANPQQRIMGQ